MVSEIVGGIGALPGPLLAQAAAVVVRARAGVTLHLAVVPPILSRATEARVKLGSMARPMQAGEQAQRAAMTKPPMAEAAGAETPTQPADAMARPILAAGVEAAAMLSVQAPAAQELS